MSETIALMMKSILKSWKDEDMKHLSLAIIWNPKFYDRFAKHYDSFLGRFFSLAEKAQKRVIEDLSSGSILDVGCGTGTLLSMAYTNGLKCYGIDASEGMLSRARIKIPNAELKRASFYDIPYAEECFDYVVETNALGGVRIDARKALSEMLRVCKDGGEVRIADYAKPPRKTWKTRMVKRLGILVGDIPQDYAKIFREFGYKAEVEILGGFDMYQFFRIKKE